MTVRPLPTILERIVVQRRQRYAVSGRQKEGFREAEAGTLGPAEKDKAKASIEGKDERPGRPNPSAPGASDDEGLAFSLSESFSSSSPSSSLPLTEAASKFLARGAGRRHAVIAEVKLGSPRLGSLVERVDPEKQARIYADHGAVALSVVVEPDFFFGSWDLLRRAKAASGLPAIAKDFVVSERQLDDAVAAGADVILLIAALYDSSELRAWAGAARARGLVPLVETHEPEEIARLAPVEARGSNGSAGSDGISHGEWELVGINNRDLRTFEVDLARSIALRPSLPAGALAVAESGIATRDDVERLAAAGFDGFLVGESLLLADDPAAKLDELVG